MITPREARSLSLQIAEVRAELAFRRATCRKLISKGTLRPAIAEERLLIWENVLHTLEQVERLDNHPRNRAVRMLLVATPAMSGAAPMTGEPKATASDYEVGATLEGEEPGKEL